MLPEYFADSTRKVCDKCAHELLSKIAPKAKVDNGLSCGELLPENFEREVCNECAENFVSKITENLNLALEFLILLCS